jgi:hypothetical protein
MDSDDSRLMCERALLRSGVVPGPRGIVAGQSGVVSSFLMYYLVVANTD